MKEIEILCNKYGSLFIIDEVQTGIGRTGTLFAYEQMGIKPDIVTIAKALGNGIPVGAVIGRKELGSSFNAGSHGSTFGGNYIAMTVCERSVTGKQGTILFKRRTGKGRIRIKEIARRVMSCRMYSKYSWQGAYDWNRI